jgi:heavy metal sensor kinase
LFFRTVRWRLTVWSTFTLAAIMAASAFYWHHNLSRNLLAQIDENLLFIARESAAQVTPDDDCAGVKAVMQRHGWEIAIRIFDPQGEILCVVAPAEGRWLIQGPSLPPYLPESPVFDTVSLPGEPPRRILVSPLPAGIVQVEGNLQAMRDSLRHLRQRFFLFSPLVLAALCFGGWFLAGHALSPLSRMARAARAIDADNLSVRLPVEHRGDEIARLAESINAMLERLEHSFRKVKQFSGDASHELRTPLAILRGETEVTLRWAREADDYRRTLESNLEEIDRMGRIIDDLLTLARSDAGELPVEMKEISLSDLLQELYMAGNTLGEAKRIPVFLHLEVEREIRIRGDELRLRQMFLNLISNAIKYTLPEGRVDISLTVVGGEAVISVADSGIGIPAQHLPHIFDRFYRIDKARNRADGGTGLGLAITKSIVEAHSGRITVGSVPEQGSTFTVYLPIHGPQGTVGEI